MKILSSIAMFTLVALNLDIVAKDFEVKLLTASEDGQTMVMSPGFLKISQGDTVTFLPSDVSHNVESVSLPQKVDKFASPMGSKFSYTFNEEGVYLYKCTPHFALGMLGVIQVDEPVNLTQVESDWSQLNAGVVMNKTRVDQYLAQIK